jgi:hypothetical protein
MKTSRRDFLRFSAIAGVSLLIRPFNSFGIASEARKFLERIGVSTGISNNSILATAGYSFVEENVRGFLVPADSDAVFEQQLALLKGSRLPVEACNSFLPGNMKCVGPGINKEDLTPYLKALKNVNYEGRMTIECSWKTLKNRLLLHLLF